MVNLDNLGTVCARIAATRNPSAQHAVIVSRVSGVPQITHWDTEQLGAEPTQEDLDAAESAIISGRTLAGLKDKLRAIIKRSGLTGQEVVSVLESWVLISKAFDEGLPALAIKALIESTTVEGAELTARKAEMLALPEFA